MVRAFASVAKQQHVLVVGSSTHHAGTALIKRRKVLVVDLLSPILDSDDGPFAIRFVSDLREPTLETMTRSSSQDIIPCTADKYSPFGTNR